MTSSGGSPGSKRCDVVDPVALYSVPVDGSASAIRLYQPMSREHLGLPPRGHPYDDLLGEAVTGFQLSPAGQRMVFTTREQRGPCSQGCTLGPVRE